MCGWLLPEPSIKVSAKLTAVLLADLTTFYLTTRTFDLQCQQLFGHGLAPD